MPLWQPSANSSSLEYQLGFNGKHFDLCVDLGEDGIPSIDVGRLVRSAGGRDLKRCDLCMGGSMVSLHSFLKCMFVEHSVQSRGFRRRLAARVMVGALCGLVSSAVEARKGEKVWAATNLVQF